MKHQFYRKLNNHGFTHHLLLPILAITAVAGIGTYLLGIDHAATPTTYDTIVVNGIQTQCVDNKNGKAVAYNPVQIYTCSNGNTNQEWAVNATATTAGEIINHNGYCLNVDNAGKTVGTAVDVYPCKNSAAQQWTVNTTTGVITNPNSKLCVAYTTPTLSTGTLLKLATCSTTAATDRWSVKSGSTGSTGTGSGSGSGTGSGSASSTTPVAGSSYAGSLELNDTGSQLVSWNNTSSFCTQQSWESPSGTVTSDSSGDANLTVSGTSGSCVSIQSPQQYSSGVIEADIDYPALPGKSGTIADWTSFWMVGSNWPNDGELDATEAEPVDGIDATSWHSGSSGAEFTASTDGFFSNTLPKDTTNLTPGWHTIDIVYTKGFFAVYYDGKEWTSYTNSNVTGDPLNIILSTGVTPNNSSVEGIIGGAPVNSSSSSTTVAIKYLKIWAYK